jgi:uncharacterized membrane protein
MKVAFVGLFVAVGILNIGLALPLMRRRVKPNRLYGLRVPATLADEWVWYEANALCGRDMVYVAGFELCFVVVLALVPGVSETAYAVSNAIVFLSLTIGMAAIGWLRANRLLRQRR